MQRTFQNGKWSMQEIAAFFAVLGAAIALTAAYSLWTLRGKMRGRRETLTQRSNDNCAPASQPMNFHEGFKESSRLPAPGRPFRLRGLFAAGFFPSIGKSISICPVEALRGFLPFGASPAIDFFSASIKLITLSALGHSIYACAPVSVLVSTDRADLVTKALQHNGG